MDKRTFLNALLRVVLLPVVLSATDFSHAPPDAFAQTRFDFLTIPTGTRNLAMGQAGAADGADPSNQYYNPSVLLSSDRVGLGFNYVSYLADISFTNFNLNAGHVFDRGNLGFNLAGSIVYTEMSVEPPDRTIFLPDGNVPGELTDRHVSLLLAGGLGTDAVDVGFGMAVKRIMSDFLEQDLDAWAFDLGLAANARIEASSAIRIITSAGMSFLNRGPRVKVGSLESNLPHQIRLGGRVRVEGSPEGWKHSYGRPLAAVTLVGDVIDRDLVSDAVGTGVEIGFLDALFFRAGRQDMNGSAGSRTTYGLGLAWTFARIRAAFEYATYDLDFIGDFNGDVNSYGASVAYSF